MKVPQGTMPEKCASRDKMRTAITEPYLKGGYLWATDSYSLTRIPVEVEDGDVDGFVTADALKMARKASGKNRPAIIGANGSQTVGEVTMPRPELGEFPNTEQLIPSDDREEIVIGLNPKLLLNIAQALGADTVRIRIDADSPNMKPYVIEALQGSSLKGDDRMGLLMPVRLPR